MGSTPSEREQWAEHFRRLPTDMLRRQACRLTDLAWTAMSVLDERDDDAPAHVPAPEYRPGASGGLAIPPPRPALRLFAPEPAGVGPRGVA